MELPFTKRLARVAAPVVVSVERLVAPVTERLLETERFVVVELVVVEFTPVKFWSVEEPVVERLEKLPVPEVVKLVAVKLVAKKFVVVADVVVALTAVKFWRVVEPLVNREPSEATEKSVEPVEERIRRRSAD